MCFHVVKGGCSARRVSTCPSACLVSIVYPHQWQKNGCSVMKCLTTTNAGLVGGENVRVPVRAKMRLSIRGQKRLTEQKPSDEPLCRHWNDLSAFTQCQVMQCSSSELVLLPWWYNHKIHIRFFFLFFCRVLQPARLKPDWGSVVRRHPFLLELKKFNAPLTQGCSLNLEFWLF